MGVGSTGRIGYLVEALGFTALVAMYIWRWQAASPRSWLVLAAWMVASALVRRDTPKTLGWRADNFWPATRKAVPFFAIASLGICLAGLFLGIPQRLPAHLIEPAALHWPNPVLVPLTLVGGVGMAWLFARERNILPLALGQAVLGALVWWAFPLAWHHSMRVGPGYWAFHQ